MQLIVETTLLSVLQEIPTRIEHHHLKRPRRIGSSPPCLSLLKAWSATHKSSLQSNLANIPTFLAALYPRDGGGVGSLFRRGAGEAEPLPHAFLGVQRR